MNTMFYVSIATAIVLIVLMIYILRTKNKGAMHYSFLTIIIEVLIWTVAVLMKGIFDTNQAASIFWENVTYFGIALVPVSLIFLGRAYSQPDKPLKRYVLLLIVPVIIFIMIWTNSLHYLFFTSYPAAGGNITPDMLGPFFWVHALYSYTAWSLRSYCCPYLRSATRAFSRCRAYSSYSADLCPPSSTCCIH